MAEAGILREDDGVELIEGEIVEMALIGTRLVIEFNWLSAGGSTRGTSERPQSGAAGRAAGA